MNNILTRWMARAGLLGGTISAIWACSPVDVDAVNWRCTSNADCESGYFCSAEVCTPAEAGGQNGIFADAVHIALIAPLSKGPSAGGAVQIGLQAAFNTVNRQGGIAGRRIVLDAYDDGYSPARAAEHAGLLAQRRSALMVVGGIGEAAAEAVAEPLIDGRVAHMSLGRGKAVRPATPARHLFTPWAGAEAEMNALVLHLRSQANPYLTNNFALFTQGGADGLDAHGQAIAAALVGPLKGQPTAFTYPVGLVDVRDAVGQGLAWLATGRDADASGLVRPVFVLGGEPAANSAFMQGLLDEFFRIRRGTSDGSEFGLAPEAVLRLGRVDDPLFVQPSGLGTDFLLNRLKTLGDVTTDDQGTRRPICARLLTAHPLPAADGSSGAALSFSDELSALDGNATISASAFEGWVIGQMIIQTLRQQGRGLSGESFIDALQSQSFELGIGSAIEFSVDDRIGSDRVIAHETTSECEWSLVELLSDPVPVDEGCTGGVCDLTGTITEDLTLTADKRYRLVGGVAIGDGLTSTTLTIEPGTVILGDPQTIGYLVVRRKSRIVAQGTAEKPVVFTSGKAPGERAAGDWGGIIINGNAPINGCASVPCEQIGEGGTGFYGGADPEDDSGVLRYVRIEFAGRLLSPNNELNGLSLQGVGRGTEIDYVQVHRGKDDGVEFFGGTVDARHLLVTGAGDDSFDWVLGWQGRGQFWIAQQIEGAGDRGVEADNNEAARDAAPRSQPTISNLTLRGNAENLGIMLREGTGAVLHNLVVSGFGSCLDIDDEETFAGLDTVLTVEGAVLDCPVVGVDNPGDPLSVDAWLRARNGIDIAAPGLGEPDFRPAMGSPAASGAIMPVGDFFEAVPFRGAMGDDDWTQGWTTDVEN